MNGCLSLLKNKPNLYMKITFFTFLISSSLVFMNASCQAANEESKEGNEQTASENTSDNEEPDNW